MTDFALKCQVMWSSTATHAERGGQRFTASFTMFMTAAAILDFEAVTVKVKNIFKRRILHWTNEKTFYSNHDTISCGNILLIFLIVLFLGIIGNYKGSFFCNESATVCLIRKAETRQFIKSFHKVCLPL